jgi:hypothetical protein
MGVFSQRQRPSTLRGNVLQPIRNLMSKRRSKSQHPPKARSSEAPPPEVPVPTATVTHAAELASEPAATSATEELDAVDAGWDTLTS